MDVMTLAVAGVAAPGKHRAEQEYRPAPGALDPDAGGALGLAGHREGGDDELRPRPDRHPAAAPHPVRRLGGRRVPAAAG